MTINSDDIRVVASIFSIIGSGILAWRVKGLLTALAGVAIVHEQNFKNLGANDSVTIIGVNSTNHIDNAQKYFLLIIGFILIILSALLNFVALVL